MRLWRNSIFAAIFKRTANANLANLKFFPVFMPPSGEFTDSNQAHSLNNAD